MRERATEGERRVNPRQNAHRPARRQVQANVRWEVLFREEIVQGEAG
jgi:hypothetical protein